MGEKSKSQKEGTSRCANKKQAAINALKRKEMHDEHRAAKLAEYRKLHGLSDHAKIIIQNDNGPVKHIDHGHVVLLSSDGKTLVLSIEFFFNVFPDTPSSLSYKSLQEGIGEVDPERLGLKNPKMSDEELRALAAEFPPDPLDTDVGKDTIPTTLPLAPISIRPENPAPVITQPKTISAVFPMNLEETHLLFENLQIIFPLIFNHAMSRGVVTHNGAMNLLAELERQGRMHGFGYRSTVRIGSHKVPDKFIGSYALNMKAAKNLKLLMDDIQRSNILPYIDNFLAEMFARLSLTAFTSNNNLASSLGAGSWASQTWYNSNNAKVFGTSFMMTDNYFRNGKHIDDDATQYALITWGLINKHNGALIHHDERLDLLEKAKNPKTRCQGLGATFTIGNVVAHLDDSDVVIATINVKVPHRTDHPTAIKSPLAETLPGQHVDRFGSSIQISNKISEALNHIGNLRGAASEEDWNEERKYYGQNYEEEAERKWNWKGGLKSTLKTEKSAFEYSADQKK